ncbi:hypothetical protein TVAG_107540 [Trichomonas vaginalis G3]|uniref:Glycosyltransferase 61 catalytic domain-containing protein n=1 Tax=Trichomonas vaginalis (strain ATCC PRA-98 / G3) TaxID=412133 RepID=A2F0Q0_TRIV3|nr:hypothetical protein TVAG_107540 [Trichomonas vaginalis G3]|eukprot:XP_001314180.1 hypothetical protein [Trichomonas vaginalis G3]
MILPGAPLRQKRLSINECIPLFFIFMYILLSIRDFLYPVAVCETLFFGPPFIKHLPVVYGEGDVNIEKQYNFNITFDPPRTNMVFWFDEPAELFNYNDTHSKGYTTIPPHFGEKSMINYWSNFTCRYTLYKNVYVNNNGCIINNTNIIEHTFCTGPIWLNIFKEGYHVTNISHGILFGHLFVRYNYGHFVHDYMIPLVMTPDEVMENATIIVPIGPRYIREFMQLLGYGDDRVLYLGNSLWVYCEHVLLATHPRPHSGHFGMGAYKLHEYLRNKMDLEKIIPTRCVFVNRFNKRIIQNMKELYKLALVKYPDIHWEYMKDKTSSLKNYAKLYSTFKAVVMANGSTVFKCIFMAAKTIIYIVNTEFWDLSNYGMMPAMDVKLVVVFNFNFYHHKKKESVNETKFMNGLDVTVFYIRNGNFPPPQPNISFIDYKFEKYPYN